jgi:hypothetical protein
MIRDGPEVARDRSNNSKRRWIKLCTANWPCPKSNFMIYSSRFSVSKSLNINSYSTPYKFVYKFLLEDDLVPPTVEGWGNKGWNDGIFFIFFCNYLTVGFVGRTSRRHPKRTWRSTAKSGGNGKGSFISSFFPFFLQGFLPRSAHPHGSDAPSMFPFAFYSPSSLEHFLISHLRMRPTRYIPLSGPLASPLQECHVTPDYFLPIVFSRRFSIYHQNDGRSLYGCPFVCLTLYYDFLFFFIVVV